MNNSARTATESNLSVSVTVFWLLSVMGALASQACALGTKLVAKWVQAAASSELLNTVHRVSVFLALTLGIIALVALPVAIRFRDAPPPRSVVRFSLAVSILALACALVFGGS